MLEYIELPMSTPVLWPLTGPPDSGDVTLGAKFEVEIRDMLSDPDEGIVVDEVLEKDCRGSTANGCVPNCSLVPVVKPTDGGWYEFFREGVAFF
jgi:hypothetical protein